MAVYRDAAAPMELQKFLYKKLFKLSSKQMAEEDAADFFTNLKIYGYIKDRERLEMKDKNGSRS